ncbi:MAG: C39 family peptidase [Andreesenia angusta]|nr:C39 family peptidase [Andreesenia angusta]
MHSFKRGFILIFSIFSLFLLTSCNNPGNIPIGTSARIGKQISGQSPEPVFKEPSFSSEVLEIMAPKEIYNIEFKNGWRLVMNHGIIGYLPPKIINYDYDNEVYLDIPVTGQFPEYHNGCEAVSIKMMLEKLGINKTKDEIADEIPKDETEAIYDEQGNLAVWGDPDKGFVGNIEGGGDGGYSIYPKAVVEYLKKYFDKPIDLTGSSIEVLERYIRAGRPVVIWATVNFQDVYSHISWNTPEGKRIDGSFNIHAMTLVGFDEENFYLNDPFTETKDMPVTKERFVEVWNQLGNKAVSID